MAINSMGSHLLWCTEYHNFWANKLEPFPCSFFKWVEGKILQFGCHAINESLIFFFYWTDWKALPPPVYKTNTVHHCYLNATRAYLQIPELKLITALKALLIVFLSLRPEQLHALSSFYPELNTSALLSDLEKDPAELAASSRDTVIFLHSTTRVLLMWRIRNSSCFAHLVYKLFYPGLKSPNFKFHSHKFVGTHNGLMGLSPAFF